MGAPRSTMLTPKNDSGLRLGVAGGSALTRSLTVRLDSGWLRLSSQVPCQLPVTEWGLTHALTHSPSLSLSLRVSEAVSHR
eukprot:2152907-Rhodomonas_salina.1